jgi:plasmid stabilization system protein ParE
MMRAVLLDQALQDFDDVFDYLEGQETGLGLRFHREYRRVLDLIERFPRLYGTAIRNYRIAPLHPFKYGMYYRVGRKHLFIHAIIDLRRNPKSILRRL